MRVRARTHIHQQASKLGVANSGQSFAVAFGDINKYIEKHVPVHARVGARTCKKHRDGKADMFVTNSGSDNALYLNNGAGKFTDITVNIDLL